VVRLQVPQAETTTARVPVRPPARVDRVARVQADRDPRVAGMTVTKETMTMKKETTNGTIRSN